MAIYFRGAEAVPLNGKATIIENGIYNSGATAEMSEVLAGKASNQTDQQFRMGFFHQTKKRIKGYHLPLVFLAGLVVGCMASQASKKERDVYSELAPSTDMVYKMKTSLLKAGLLLQGMDTVIENANKNFDTREGK